jgi:uncharacterized protein
LYKSKYSVCLRVDENEYLLINCRTGAVDVVDKEAIELLQNDFSRVDSSIIEFFKNRGHITSLLPEEETLRMEELCTSLHRRFSQKKSHIIIPTYECNLRCTYCWERSLHSNGKEWVRKTLSYDEVDLLFEALDQIDEGVVRKEPLVYFGGEPLLPHNIELINYMMRICESTAEP